MPGSVTWRLRLLELLAVACHGIAVFCYSLDDGLRKYAEHEPWLSNQLAMLSEFIYDRGRLLSAYTVSEWLLRSLLAVYQRSGCCGRILGGGRDLWRWSLCLAVERTAKT